MRILMLTPRFPYPPDRGDTLRTWEMLAYLAARHEVWLASLNPHDPGAQARRIVADACHTVAVRARGRMASMLSGAVSLLGGRSFTQGYFGLAALGRVVREWASRVEFDAVLACSSAMAPLSDCVPARRVLDMCDVDSHKWRSYQRRGRPLLRPIFGLESRRVRELERRAAAGHDVTLLVNQRERRKLLAFARPRRCELLRTCIRPIENDSAARPEHPVVGTLGSMFYPPNVRAVEWFAQRVWPRVRAAVRGAEWRVVGSRPTRRVRRLGKLPGVVVTGFVPDAAAELSGFRVFANPVSDALGVQSKLLCALAAGCAAVVTRNTAAGIDYPGEAPFLIADEPRAFADAVILLLRDEQLASRLAAEGRRVIEQNYRCETQFPELERWLVGAGRKPAAATSSAPTAHDPSETPA